MSERKQDLNGYEVAFIDVNGAPAIWRDDVGRLFGYDTNDKFVEVNNCCIPISGVEQKDFVKEVGSIARELTDHEEALETVDDVIMFINKTAEEVTGNVYITVLDEVITLYSHAGYEELLITDDMSVEELNDKLHHMDVDNLYLAKYIFDFTDDDMTVEEHFASVGITHEDINFDNEVTKIEKKREHGENDFIVFLDLKDGYARMLFKEGQTAEFEDVLQTLNSKTDISDEEDESYRSIIDEITADTIEACECYNANKYHKIKEIVSIARLDDVVSFTIVTNCGMVFTDSMTIYGVGASIEALDELLDEEGLTPVDDTVTALISCHIIN